MNPLLILAGAVGLAVYVIGRRLRGGGTSSSPTLPASTSSRTTMLRAALAALPDASTILQIPVPLWDAILGGRIGDSFGAPAWRYFAIYAGENPDGTKRKGGTTCGVFAAYVAAKAGFPVEFVNRAKDDQWAPGSGFTAGDHISKFIGAAKSKKFGWWVPADFPDARIAAVAAPTAPTAPISGWAPAFVGPADEELAQVGAAPFMLAPGDYYLQNREGAMFDGKLVDGSHVGIVKEVGEPDAQGNRTVVTLDGGDTCDKGQCARWHTRTLSSSGIMSYGGVQSKLVGVVRRPAA